MRRWLFTTLVVAVVGAAMTAAVINAKADSGILEGDTRLSCEALLCLASGKKPTECGPSLNRYFSINCGKFIDTIRERRKFLDLCPAANQSPEMAGLADALANGAGRCDVVSLNKLYIPGSGDLVFYISNQIPSYCAYLSNPYTSYDDTRPVYVGLPERGGHWVEAKDYDQELRAYNERIKAEDEAKEKALRELLGTL